MNVHQQNARINDHETPESIRSGGNQALKSQANYYGHLPASEAQFILQKPTSSNQTKTQQQSMQKFFQQNMAQNQMKMNKKQSIKQASKNEAITQQMVAHKMDESMANGAYSAQLMMSNSSSKNMQKVKMQPNMQLGSDAYQEGAHNFSYQIASERTKSKNHSKTRKNDPLSGGPAERVMNSRQRQPNGSVGRQRAGTSIQKANIK